VERGWRGTGGGRGRSDRPIEDSLGGRRGVKEAGGGEVGHGPTATITTTLGISIGLKPEDDRGSGVWMEGRKPEAGRGRRPGCQASALESGGVPCRGATTSKDTGVSVLHRALQGRPNGNGNGNGKERKGGQKREACGGEAVVGVPRSGGPTAAGLRGVARRHRRGRPDVHTLDLGGLRIPGDHCLLRGWEGDRGCTTREVRSPRSPTVPPLPPPTRAPVRMAGPRALAKGP